MKNPEKIVTECGEAMAKIHECRNRLYSERIALNSELQALKSDMPALLVSVELGESKQSEVTRLKRKLSGVEERLADIDLVDTGLKSREGEIERRNGVASRELDRLKAKDRYKALCDTVRGLDREDDFNGLLENDVRVNGILAGLEEDAKQFINRQKSRLSRLRSERLFGA